ncbi:MAG: DUF4129 domain-containing protein [Saprospiraceae bacterium]|nr:DUF4129 domain-containing protein [Saprospiraceae bacterium]
MNRKWLTCLVITVTLSWTTGHAQFQPTLDTAAWQAKIRTLPDYQGPATRWQRNQPSSRLSKGQRIHEDSLPASKEENESMRPIQIPGWINSIFQLLMVGLGMVIIYLLVRQLKPGHLFPTQIKDSPLVEPEVQLTTYSGPWFLREIEVARNSGNTLQVIRMQFLYALWLLDQRRMIKWRKEKTNTNYALELSGHPELQDEFARQARFYEQVWYGEQQVADHSWQTQMSLGDHFIQSIQSTEQHA